jgi:uncharacterized protein (DUF342 family)
MDVDQILERVKIEVDESGVFVYAVVLSDVDECEYSEQWLETQLIQQGHCGLKFIETAHKEIAELLKENQSGKVKLGQKINATVAVIISHDLLSARLLIPSAQGGKPISTEEVVKALNEKEIDLNLVNKKRVVGLIRQSRIIDPGEVVEVVFVKGWAPINGQDTQFECLIDDFTDRRPSQRVDGTLPIFAAFN